MTKYFDGVNGLIIEMKENGSLDFSADFFNVSNLVYDADTDIYMVSSVNNLVESAEDWKNFAGDFRDDVPAEREVNYRTFPVSAVPVFAAVVKKMQL